MTSGSSRRPVSAAKEETSRFWRTLPRGAVPASRACGSRSSAMPSTSSSFAGVRTSGSEAREAGAAIQPRSTSTCHSEPARRSGFTTSYPGRPCRSLLSRSTVRSATKRPRTATCLWINPAVSAPGTSATGGERKARSNCAPIVRFSSARRACQLPKNTKATHAAAVRARAQPAGRKEYPRSMRYVVIGIFVAIVVSLFSALFFVYQDRGASTRALKALALRLALSVGLFAFLMLGYYLGWFRERLSPINKDEQAEPHHVDTVPVPSHTLAAEAMVDGE